MVEDLGYRDPQQPSCLSLAGPPLLPNLHLRSGFSGLPTPFLHPVVILAFSARLCPLGLGFSLSGMRFVRIASPEAWSLGPAEPFLGEGAARVKDEYHNLLGLGLSVKRALKPVYGPCRPFLGEVPQWCWMGRGWCLRAHKMRGSRFGTTLLGRPWPPCFVESASAFLHLAPMSPTPRKGGDMHLEVTFGNPVSLC